MTVTKWVLSDPDDSTSHVFAINPTPKTGSGDVAYERPVINAYEGDNGPMVSLGQQVGQSSQFQVETLDQAEHNALWEWFDKSKKLTLTDDWGRTMTILITKIKTQRPHKTSNVFYRQCTVNFNVVSLVEV